MWPFKRKPWPNESAPVDDELWEATRSIVRRETDSLRAAGRVQVEEKTGPHDEAVAGSFDIQPVQPEAASLHMSVWDDTVTFGPGASGANIEIWSKADPEWDSTLRELIQCVKEGRYSERVKQGLIFSLKVEMRFDGVQDGRGRTYSANYASLEAEGEIPEGERSYAPW